MADYVDPFDDPAFRPGQGTPSPAKTGGDYIDPFDDPNYRPGGGTAVPAPPPPSTRRDYPGAEGFNVFEPPEFRQRLRASPEGSARLFGEGVEDYPELTSADVSGLPATSQAATAAGLMFAPEADAADIAVKNIPGSTIEETDYGDKLIVIPEDQENGLKAGKYFVNRPGPSAQDVFNVAGLGLAFTPAGRYAARGIGVAARTGRAALTAGGTQAALEAGTQALGSEQPVSMERVAGAAAGGALAEIVAPIFSLIGNKLKAVDLPDAGPVNDSVRKVFRDVGVDIDNMPQQVRRQLKLLLARSEAENRIAAKEATRIANEAGERGMGIRLTRGQRTGDIGQIAKEQDILDVGRGTRAAQRLTDFVDEQTTDIRKAAERLQAKLSGGRTQVEGQPEFGGAMIESVRNAANVAKRRISDAYDAANLADPDLTLDNLEGLTQSVMKGLREGKRVVDPKLTPATMQAMRELRRLQRMGRGKTAIVRDPETGVRIAGGERTLKPVMLQRFETARRKLNSLIDTADNPTDQANVIAMKSSMDDWLDNAVDSGLMSGEGEAVDLLKKARGLRADFGRKFQTAKQQADADAGRLIDRIIKTDVTNVEAADYVFGRSAIGENASAMRVTERMRDIFGEDSQQWNAIREAAFRRILFGPKEKGMQKMGRQNIVNSITDAVENRGKQLVGRLFDPEEIAEMKAFRDAVQATIPPARTTNPSRTGAAVARLMAQSFKRLAMFSGDLTTAVALQAAEAAGPIGRGATARRATAPLRLPAMPSVRLSIPAAPAGAAAADYLSQSSESRQGSAPGQ